MAGSCNPSKPATASRGGSCDTRTIGRRRPPRQAASDGAARRSRGTPALYRETLRSPPNSSRPGGDGARTPPARGAIRGVLRTLRVGSGHPKNRHRPCRRWIGPRPLADLVAGAGSSSSRRLGRTPPRCREPRADPARAQRRAPYPGYASQADCFGRTKKPAEQGAAQK